MASLCKTLVLSSPLKKVELGYFGPDRIDPKQVDELRAQAVLDGKAQAEEMHNAQILEFREELRSLHDDILGSLIQEFEAMKTGVAEALPRMAIALLKKTLPTVKLDAAAIKEQIDELTTQYVSDDGDSVKAFVAEEDFKLICKAAGAAEGAEHIKEGAITILPSENLSHGDCQIQSRFGLIDASVETKVKHLEIALLGQ